MSSVYPVVPASIPNDKFTNPEQGPNEITTQTITNSTADVPLAPGKKKKNRKSKPLQSDDSEEEQQKKQQMRTKTRRGKQITRFIEKENFEFVHHDEFDQSASKLFEKETFKGVSSMLNLDSSIDELTPIVFIIKNIKQFNP